MRLLRGTRTAERSDFVALRWRAGDRCTRSVRRRPLQRGAQGSLTRRDAAKPELPLRDVQVSCLPSLEFLAVHIKANHC
jgi:hypothetical protein